MTQPSGEWHETSLPGPSRWCMAGPVNWSLVLIMRRPSGPFDTFLLSGDGTGPIYWDGFDAFPGQGSPWFLPPRADILARVPASGGPVAVAGVAALPYHTFTGTGTTGGYVWGGIGFSSVEGYYYPPDNGMAANAAASGFQTVVSAENGAIMITSLNTSSATSPALSSTESLNAFFGNPSSGGFYSDPRVLFDGTHFIVVIDDINPSAATSYVKYAISTTSTPGGNFATGDWTVSQVSTTINGSWSDQPLAAANGGYLYITTNQFSSSGSYQADYLTAVSTALPTPGTQTPAASFALNGPSYQPASISHGTSPVQYFIDHTGGTLNYIGMNATAVVSSGSISGMPANGSFSASQYGVSNKLDAGDGRVTGAAYDAGNNVLYAVFEARPTSSKVPTVELVQFKPGSTQASVVLLNSLIANLSGLPAGSSTSGAATFNASVAVDNLGDLLINFNVSGPSMFAADVYAVWKAGIGAAPSLNTALRVFDYNNSVAAYVDPARDSVGRWGDYSTAVADASAPNGFWISNEWANGSVQLNGSTYSSWGTALAHVSV